MDRQNDLPYIECSRIISNISLALSKNGETQFIPYVNFHETFSDKFDKQAFLQGVHEFDFVLAAPTGKYILSILMLNKLYLDVKALFNLSKQEIQRKLKLLINTIDADPPESQKLVRKLLLMKADIDKESKEIFLSFNYQLKAFNECITSNDIMSKELFHAPLKYLEEYNIGKLFFELCSYLEFMILSLTDKLIAKENRHLMENIFALKENIIEGDIDIIYGSFLNLINEVLFIIESKRSPLDLKQVNNIEHENKIYIRRFLAQLVKLGEHVTDVKNLEAKLNDFSLAHKVRISSVIDEEIQGLARCISKQNIVTARLELRLNDDQYPLSVSYREFVRNLL